MLDSAYCAIWFNYKHNGDDEPYDYQLYALSPSVNVQAEQT
jgi:hypothetical protein